MKIEHIGICVSHPIDMGNWYKNNLGFSVVRSSGNNEFGVMFLVDDSGETVIEIGRLPDEPIIDFKTIEPIQFHIAIDCENPKSEAERLVAAGAILVGECPMNDYPGEKIFIRDPWGTGIQLVKRQHDLKGSARQIA